METPFNPGECAEFMSRPVFQKEGIMEGLISTKDLMARAWDDIAFDSDMSRFLATALLKRLKELDEWKQEVTKVVNPHLTEEDGTDMIPDYARIENMLDRLSSYIP